MNDASSGQPISRRAVLGALAAAPLALASASAATAPSVGNTSGRVRLPDGRCLGYASFGNPNGPLVLYFHGTPGARLEAELVHQEAAARGVRLVAVERPGIGLSSYQSNRRILNWPADIANFVSLIGYGNSAFGIIGVSGGAPYALACELCMPHRLTHVAVVSGHTPMCAPVVPGNQDARIQRLSNRPIIANIFGRVSRRMLYRRPERLTMKIAESWSASDRQLILCNPMLKSKFQANLREAARNGHQAILTDVRLLNANWGYRLDRLPPVPTSFWYGGCDRIATPSMGVYFHRQVAGSELFADPSAGHVTMLKWHATEILAKFPV